MRALLLLALASSGCVLDSSHVSTELIAVCTDDVPLVFERTGADESVARVEVTKVGATVDDPDARATLATVSLEVLNGVDDLSFAQAMTLDVLAPGSGLPDARVVDAPVAGLDRVSAHGDDQIDLVEYLTSDSLTIRIALEGPSPGDFALMLDACLDVDGLVVEDDDE
jgi:hypothetical protein